MQGAELFAGFVLRKHGEHRLGGTERHALPPEGDASGEHGVLELVPALGELGGRQPGLARLAQAVAALAILVSGGFFRRAESLELIPGEEVRVAGDDRGLLGDFLLAHAHGAALLRALEEIAAEAVLVLSWAADGCDAHRRESTYLHRLQERSGCGGLARGEHPNRLREHLELERLTDEHDPFLARRIDFRCAAQQADPGLRVLLAQDGKELQAVSVSDVQVEQHDVHVLRAEQLLRALDPRRLENPVALQLEVHAAEQSQ